MPEPNASKIIRAGAKTYFFDLKQTKDGKPFLVITESRFKGEGSERQRVRITVFPEQAQEFSQTLQEMVSHLNS